MFEFSRFVCYIFRGKNDLSSKQNHGVVINILQTIECCTNFHTSVFTHLWIDNESLLLIHFFTCYSYIVWKVKKSRSCLNYGASTVSNASVQNKTQSPSLNKVPFVSSFCLFFIISNILIVLVVTVPDVKVAEQYYKYLIFFHEVNVSMDALIYIRLSPRIKKLAIALFSLCHRCCYSTQSQVDSRNRQQPSTITSSIASVPDHCHETEF